MDKHPAPLTLNGLLAQMNAQRLAWVTEQLARLGRDDDPVEIKAVIDRSASRDGFLYAAGNRWYVRAAYIIAARPVIRYVVDVVHVQTDTLQRLGLIPTPEPEDPRERALHLRKHRNTGPTKALPGARREYGRKKL